MKTTRFGRILAAVLAASTPAGAARAASPGAPKGWFLAGSAAAEYAAGLETAQAHKGKGSATLGWIGPSQSGFGTLMQTISAGSYLGKRMRLGAYVRGRGVSGWAGLWMRVDGEAGRVLAFDNMESRALKGDFEWRRCEVVLDVPRSARRIAFGILLEGKGKVWLDEVRLEEAPEAALTGGLGGGQDPPAPVNTDFEP